MIFKRCQNIYIFTLRYVQGLCQSTLCEADYALSYLTYVLTTASHLKGRTPDRQSQSHVTADGQSTSPPLCRAPSGTHDQILSSIY